MHLRIVGDDDYGDTDLSDEVTLDRISSVVIRSKSQYRLFYPVTATGQLSSKGIIGDRFFHNFNSDREQITLIEKENIDYYNHAFETNFNYLDFRRNLVTENIR